ncbi:MAG: 4-hydroxy-tetrahydrodipicolinate synthase [Bacteroidales bacterium]|nr:4-hydroxy-tetrahydrodipicolinate synthase [Bacteroidales bacterium]
MNSNFFGTGVALVTPFDINGNVDYVAFARLLSNVVDGGVDYVLVMGTTGETPCLSVEERRKVIDFAKREIAGRVPIMVGMSGNNTSDLLDCIRNFDFNGIGGLLTASPFYNKPVQNGLYAHFAHVAEVSPVPVILYNIPGRTGVNISPETICRLARDFDNIIAVKEASGSVDQIMRVVENKPERFTVISGDDGLTLPLMAAGVKGVISVVANAFPRELSQMVKLALNGDFDQARKLHYRLLPTVRLMFAEGNPAGVKAYLSQMGVIQNVLRLPLVNVSDDLYARIANDIERLKKVYGF